MKIIIPDVEIQPCVVYSDEKPKSNEKEGEKADDKS